MVHKLTRSSSDCRQMPSSVQKRKVCKNWSKFPCAHALGALGSWSYGQIIYTYTEECIELSSVGLAPAPPN